MNREDYPNLIALLEGRVSGTFVEWPQIKNEVNKLLSECEKLKEGIKEILSWDYRCFSAQSEELQWFLDARDKLQKLLGEV